MNHILNDLYLSQKNSGNPVIDSLLQQKRNFIEKMQDKPQNSMNYWDSIQVLNSRIDYLYQKLGIPQPPTPHSESVINTQLQNAPVNKEYIEKLLKAYANTTHSFVGGGPKYRKLIDDLEKVDYQAFGGLIHSRINSVKNKSVRQKAGNTIGIIDKLYNIYKSEGNRTEKLDKFENVLKESNNYHRDIVYTTVRGLSKKLGN